MTERRPGTATNDAAAERALTRFRDTLKGKGLNFSSVREAIFQVAFAFDGHFDVNDLVHALREAGVSGAHLTTVYRTLPLLLEAGIIQPVLLCAGDRHLYESAFEREHHDHLVCTECGKIVEFHFEALEALQRDVAAHYGFELTSHVHELLGRCDGCRRGERVQLAPAGRASSALKDATSRASRDGRDGRARPTERRSARAKS